MALFFSGQKPIITRFFDEPGQLPARGTVTITVINAFCNVPQDDESILSYGMPIKVPKGHYKTLGDIIVAISVSSKKWGLPDVITYDGDRTIRVQTMIEVREGYAQRLLGLRLGTIAKGESFDVIYDSSLIGSGVIASVLGVNILMPWTQRGGFMVGKTTGVVNIDWKRNTVIAMDVMGTTFEMVDAAVSVEEDDD